MIGPISSRPHFKNGEDWHRHYQSAIDHGNCPYPPVTREELEIADRHGLFEIYPQWLPGPAGLALLGLAAWFGRRVEPFDELERERHLVTLEADPEYARAMYRLLKRGAGQ